MEIVVPPLNQGHSMADTFSGPSGQDYGFQTGRGLGVPKCQKVPTWECRLGVGVHGWHHDIAVRYGASIWHFATPFRPVGRGRRKVPNRRPQTLWPQAARPCSCCLRTCLRLMVSQSAKPAGTGSGIGPSQSSKLLRSLPFPPISTGNYSYCVINSLPATGTLHL